MFKCNDCKWFDRDCLMGLEVEKCDAYAKPVEESCRQCEYHIGRGECKLNLEGECAEDHYGMYTLSKAAKRDCEECDNFIGGECAKGLEPGKYCMEYVSWPMVPNWGAKV